MFKRIGRCREMRIRRVFCVLNLKYSLRQYPKEFAAAVNIHQAIFLRAAPAGSIGGSSDAIKNEVTAALK